MGSVYYIKLLSLFSLIVTDINGNNIFLYLVNNVANVIINFLFILKCIRRLYSSNGRWPK